MKFLDKLGNVLSSAGNLFGNWVDEPLKRAEYARLEKAKQVEHERLVELKQAENERLIKLKQVEYDLLEKIKDRDIEREIEREIGVKKALSEQNMKEQAFLSQQKIKEEESLAKLRIEISQRQAEIEKFNSQQNMIEMEFSTNMKIKQETEIVRINTEIEQLKKDKEFHRMKEASYAVMELQKELTRINLEGGVAILSMRENSQRNAYDLINEQKEKFTKSKFDTIRESAEQLAWIDNNPNMDEISKNIMRNVIDESLKDTINETKKFIAQLSDDMQLISKDISLMTSSGQKFIENHLQQFQLIGFSEQTTALLEHDDSTRKQGRIGR